MLRLLKVIGSLHMAVPLLIAIAGVLGWGTIYETGFGTAAVQRFVYRSLWFQALLGFLAVNLAAAALQRFPWKRRHLPFVLAHIGIILVLIGGIIGGRFGIEGQLIIPENQTNDMLLLPQNVLVAHLPNPGFHQVFPVDFETTAWNHQPRAIFPVEHEGRRILLTVDRYFPNAEVKEEITEEGIEENPAVHVWLTEPPQEEAPLRGTFLDRNFEEGIWLFAKDPDRFGVRWGSSHLLFLQPQTDVQLAQLLGGPDRSDQSRGMVSIQLANQEQPVEIPVPGGMNEPIPVPGTPYRITFKQYFADFGLTEQGPVSRSEEPNNPAVALTLTGPEGTDAHLLFAFHPEFAAIHGRQHRIHAHLSYTHPAGSMLPPDSIGLIRTPVGRLLAVLTGSAGERETIEPVEVGRPYAHPWGGTRFEVTAHFPRAKLIQQVVNRDNEVKAETIHVVGQEGSGAAEAWVGLRQTQELALSEHPIRVEFRPGEWRLPFSVKLLDFRKIDYPGTEMASGFESDVELTDPEKGLVLTRKISMNNPLKYRGFSLFQSSYVPGPVETTVLSVRNDPGTPLVYTGFLIIVAGVISMFVLRRSNPVIASPEGAKQSHRES